MPTRVMPQTALTQTRHYMQSYEKLSVYMAYSTNSLPLNQLALSRCSLFSHCLLWVAFACIFSCIAHKVPSKNKRNLLKLSLKLHQSQF